MLYETDPTDDELARWGMDRALYAKLQAKEEIIPATQEMADAFDLFCACSTQWRVGACGATGLDYLAVKEVAISLGLDFHALLPLLQVCERSALKTMRKK